MIWHVCMFFEHFSLALENLEMYYAIAVDALVLHRCVGIIFNDAVNYASYTWVNRRICWIWFVVRINGNDFWKIRMSVFFCFLIHSFSSTEREQYAVEYQLTLTDYFCSVLSAIYNIKLINLATTKSLQINKILNSCHVTQYNVPIHWYDCSNNMLSPCVPNWNLEIVYIFGIKHIVSPFFYHKITGFYGFHFFFRTITLICDHLSQHLSSTLYNGHWA